MIFLHKSSKFVPARARILFSNATATPARDGRVGLEDSNKDSDGQGNVLKRS